MTRRKFNKIASIVGISALVLATAMGIFTFFGANGNNFVINFAPTENYNISLFTTEDRSVPLTRVSFEGLNDMNNITYDSGVPENIEDGMGSKNEKVRRGYMAFSYYLGNLSNVPVNIKMSMDISKSTHNVESAARVMIIVDGVREVYAKAQEVGGNIGSPEHISTQGSSLTTPFASDKIIMHERELKDIQPNTYIKITVVVWLEGWDEQCNDSIKGGMLRTKMDLWVF